MFNIINIIDSYITSDAVPIKVHADYCRNVDTKNLLRQTWVVIQSVPLQVARPYYINGRKNTLGRCSETPVRECPNCLSCPIYRLYYTSVRFL